MPVAGALRRQVAEYEQWEKQQKKRRAGGTEGGETSSEDEDSEAEVDPEDPEAVARKERREEKRARKNWMNCTPSGGRFGRDQYVSGGARNGKDQRYGLVMSSQYPPAHHGRG